MNTQDEDREVVQSHALTRSLSLKPSPRAGISADSFSAPQPDCQFMMKRANVIYATLCLRLQASQSYKSLLQRSSAQDRNKTETYAKNSLPKNLGLTCCHRTR